MSQVLPKGETLRRAIRYISDRLREDENLSPMALVDEATLRFDLSPKDSEFLIGFYRDATRRQIDD
jgi:hypothetical protein